MISGNGQQGIYLVGTNGSVTGNVIQGNLIGLDATGSDSLGNGNAGIGILRRPTIKSAGRPPPRGM